MPRPATEGAEVIQREHPMHDLAAQNHTEAAKEEQRWKDDVREAPAPDDITSIQLLVPHSES